jgi:YCII-related domain
MHALVLMAIGPAGIPDELQRDHERFIDDLDRANQVVLGGGLKPGVAPYGGAYLLSCGSLDEARDIAASDPLVRGGAVRCDVVEWELVGVNPDAVDRSALLYP